MECINKARSYFHHTKHIVKMRVRNFHRAKGHLQKRVNHHINRVTHLLNPINWIPPFNSKYCSMNFALMAFVGHFWEQRKTYEINRYPDTLRDPVALISYTLQNSEIWHSGLDIEAFFISKSCVLYCILLQKRKERSI